MNLEQFKEMVKDDQIQDDMITACLWELLKDANKDVDLNSEEVTLLRFEVIFKVLGEADNWYRKQLYASLAGLFKKVAVAIEKMETEMSLRVLEKAAGDESKSDEEVEKIFDEAFKSMKDIDGRRKVFDILREHLPLREMLFIKKLKENSVSG